MNTELVKHRSHGVTSYGKRKRVGGTRLNLSRFLFESNTTQMESCFLNSEYQITTRWLFRELPYCDDHSMVSLTISILVLFQLRRALQSSLVFKTLIYLA